MAIGWKSFLSENRRSNGAAAGSFGLEIESVLMDASAERLRLDGISGGTPVAHDRAMGVPLLSERAMGRDKAHNSLTERQGLHAIRPALSI